MSTKLASKRALQRFRKLQNSKRNDGHLASAEGLGMQVLIVSNTVLYRHLARTLPRQGDKALEIGSAHGHCTALFKCEAVGVDLDLGHVESAQEKYPHCRFLRADIFGENVSWIDRSTTVLFLDIGGNRNYKPVMKALAICIRLMPALRLVVAKSVEVRSCLLRSANSVSMVARDLAVSKDDDAEAAGELANEIRQRGGEWPVSLIYSLKCGPRLRYLVGKQRILAFLTRQAPLLQRVTVSTGPPEHRERVRVAPGAIQPSAPEELLAVHQELTRNLCLQLPIGEKWPLRAVFSRIRRRCLKKLLASASNPKLYQQASDISLDDRCIEPWSEAWQVSVAVRHLHAFLVAAPEFTVVGSALGDVPTMEELWRFEVTCISGADALAAAHADDTPAGHQSNPPDSPMMVADCREMALQVLDCKWRLDNDVPELQELIVERAWILKGEQVVADLTDNTQTSRDDVDIAHNSAVRSNLSPAQSPTEGEDLQVEGGEEVCVKAPGSKKTASALLEALQERNDAEVELLLKGPDAPLMLRAKSARGCTPLMLAAMGYCSEELTEKMLSFGPNVVQAALRSPNGRTAKEYAAIHNATPKLCAKLQEAEFQDQASMCMVCKARLCPRTKLAKLVTSCRRHEENNAVLMRFVENDLKVVDKLLQSHFHTLNDDKALRKKLSQSLSVLEALERIVPNLQNWHVIDLCCGKSLTSILAVLRHPGCVATAVDRVLPCNMPHYAEAGLDTVRYRRLDVLAADAIDRLRSWSLDDDGQWAGRPVAVLGMHLCGRLSEQAAELFSSCSRAGACVLSPCCLPSMEKAPIALQPLYRQRASLDFRTLDKQQYQGWCEHLRSLLSAVKGTRVESMEAKST